MFYFDWCCCEFFIGYRLRGVRVSGARSNHTHRDRGPPARLNRSEADFSAAVTQQTRSTSATQTSPKASVKTAGVRHAEEILNVSERGAISHRSGDEIVGERGAEMSGAVCSDFERWSGGANTHVSGSGNSHRSAPLTCSARICTIKPQTDYLNMNPACCMCLNMYWSAHNAHGDFIQRLPPH